VSPVKYELGSYIPEDDVFHSRRRESLISYAIQKDFTHNILNINVQTPWPLVRKQTLPTERPPLVSNINVQPLKTDLAFTQTLQTCSN
jgi:hypothetical protein